MVSHFFVENDSLSLPSAMLIFTGASAHLYMLSFCDRPVHVRLQT